jgi:acyl CoA:acetate/3-ketoacid CoA transferase beta subunit
MKTIALEAAVAMIPDGAALMVGGFMGVGTPEQLVDELVRQGKRGMTVIGNDTALPGRGIGKLVTAGVLHKAIVSHIGLNPETQQKQNTAKGKSKLVRQCTLPLTSLRPVDMVVTELAVVSFAGGVATLLETAPGVTVEEVLGATEASLAVPDQVRQMNIEGAIS